MSRKGRLKRIKKFLKQYLKKKDEKLCSLGDVVSSGNGMDKLFDGDNAYNQQFSKMANIHFEDALELRSLLRKCLMLDDEAKGESEYTFKIGVTKIFTKDDPYDNVVDYLIQELEYGEDKALRAVLETELMGDNRCEGQEFNSISSERLRYKLERMRLVISKFVINRDVLTDIIKYLHKMVDPIGESELILHGYLGNYDNVMLITSSGFNSKEALEPGEVYALTEPEFLGIFKFVEKLTNTLEPQGKDKFLWKWSETVRIGIVNPRGIAKWKRN